MSKPHEHWDFGLHPNKEETEVLPEGFTYNPSGIRRTYAVKLNLKEDTNVQKIQYTIDVICSSYTPSGGAIFEIYKHQPFINGSAPDTQIEQLAWTCGAVCYPMHIKTNALGNAITITNHTAIKKRWQTQRKKIKQSYSGATVTQLLQNMDAIINNQKKMRHVLLEQDWFTVLFFKPLTTAVSGFETQTQWRLPVLPYADAVPYSIQQSATYHPTNTQEIIVTQQGHDMVTEAVPSRPTFHLTQHICEGSSVADKIEGTCTYIDTESTYMATISIAHQRSYTPKTAEEKTKEQQAIQKQLETELAPRLYPSLWKRLQNTMKQYKMATHTKNSTS